MSHTPNPPPDWLAGYADGELPPNERMRAEQRLAEQPELRSLLEDQEALGPTNTDFWRSVEPPKPTASQWQRVQAELPAPPLRLRTWGRWLGALALAATAASVLFLVNLIQRPAPTPAFPTPPSNVFDEPLGFLEMALAGDVEIYCLPEEMASLLITGSHPLGSEVLQLARADEIEFHGIGADPEGRFPNDPKDPQAKEPPPPVIWAPDAP